ncbi:MAG: DUF427 domain-containing protein, partial [Chloroflexi bacterium]
MATIGRGTTSIRPALILSRRRAFESTVSIRRECQEVAMKQPVQEGMFETRFRMWTERGGRIRLEPSERWVRASLGGTVVADSKRVQLLYLPPPLNSYAFPRADVRWDLVRESDDVGSMPGLGEVKHWSVSVGGKV